MDDTFLLFKDPDHISKFLDYLNVQHPNIKFTMETECNNTLSFLDCSITRTNNLFISNVFRKPTFTGLGTSFFSFCSFRFKINSVYTLINRAYKVCSTYDNLHSELGFLCNYFKENGYSVNIVNSCVKRFLSKINSTLIAQSDNLQQFYCSLPYFGAASDRMCNELKIIFKKYFPNIQLSIILTNDFKIGSFFRYKDTLPKVLRSSLIYQYSCVQCTSAYVGMTSRNLYERIAEHRGFSSRTNRPLAKPPHSAVRLHSEQCGSFPTSDNFKILAQCNKKDLRILESLFIYKVRPILNNTESSYPLKIVTV